MPELSTLGLKLAKATEPYLDIYEADEYLSALRVVRLAAPGHVVYARPPELEALAPLGITTTSAAPAAQVELCTHGEMQDAAWAWNPGSPVLLGTDGVLTQAQPADQPYIIVMGMAVRSDTIIVRINAPLFVSLTV